MSKFDSITWGFWRRKQSKTTKLHYLHKSFSGMLINYSQVLYIISNILQIPIAIHHDMVHISPWPQSKMYNVKQSEIVSFNAYKYKIINTIPMNKKKKTSVKSFVLDMYNVLCIWSCPCRPTLITLCKHSIFFCSCVCLFFGSNKTSVISLALSSHASRFRLEKGSHNFMPWWTWLKIYIICIQKNKTIKPSIITCILQKYINIISNTIT